ncbi:Fungal specific transcription factor domain-containing protein isoform 2 [Cladophialophora immunda]|nr:Fungal specific transcription factor domain-containing protein isoform 2 [Cladophialophora immunda]
MSARSTAPRNAIACVPCRTAKLRCSHHNQAPCDRCRSAGRAASCYFPQKWTSALHRQPKKPRRAVHVQQPRKDSGLGASESFIPAGEQPGRLDPTEGLDTLPAEKVPTDGPLRWFTKDVQQCYLRCTYKWSFHHKPRLLQQIRDGTLDTALAWAMLTLASRYSPTPACFSSPLEASDFFAQRASRAVQLRITSPSLPQVQALLLLTGHKWGAGDGQSAWIYLGIAVRMVQMMGLCSESLNTSDDVSASEAFILAEERRRTAWTCFLMESLLSGGGSRARILTSEDMRIQLPCEDEAFVFGIPVQCELLNDAFSQQKRPDTMPSLSILAYTVRVADIWGHVAKWASCDESVTESLDHQGSRVHSLISSLEHWKLTLPDRLRYSLFSLQAHSVLEQGQGFCYMHCIYFVAVIFLHRHDLPYLGLSKSPRSLDGLDQEAFRDWAGRSSHTLYDTASTVCDMCEEINRLGADFRRGLVPWIGFTVYTTIGVMLYFQSFPLEPRAEFLTKTRHRLHSAYLLLKEMKNEWPMASRWLENIYSLQKYHASRVQQANLSVEELQSFRNLMVDYGALHDTPVSDPATVSVRSTGNTLDLASESNTHSGLEARQRSYAQLGDTPQSARTGSASDASLVDVLHVPNDFDGADYLVSEEEMAGIFQEFWTMFPGEVGAGNMAL